MSDNTVMKAIADVYFDIIHDEQEIIDTELQQIEFVIDLMSRVDGSTEGSINDPDSYKIMQAHLTKRLRRLNQITTGFMAGSQLEKARGKNYRGFRLPMTDKVNVELSRQRAERLSVRNGRAHSEHGHNGAQSS